MRVASFYSRMRFAAKHSGAPGGRNSSGRPEFKARRWNELRIVNISCTLSAGQHPRKGGKTPGGWCHLHSSTTPKAVHKFLIATSLLVASVLPPAAVAGEDISAIGPHKPILIVEKNVNPQNVMVIYTKIDANGRFTRNAEDGNRPVFGFYWLMDGKTYKPVNRMIKTEIRKRFENQWSPGGRAAHFTINVNDLKEVNCDIKVPKVDVYARESDNAPAVEAQMNLGPSNGNMRIRLSSIRTEGRAFPPAVHSVTLKGEEIVNGLPTGKKVIRKYEAESGSN